MSESESSYLNASNLDESDNKELIKLVVANMLHIDTSLQHYRQKFTGQKMNVSKNSPKHKLTVYHIIFYEI